MFCFGLDVSAMEQQINNAVAITLEQGGLQAVCMARVLHGFLMLLGCVRQIVNMHCVHPARRWHFKGE